MSATVPVGNYSASPDSNDCASTSRRHVGRSRGRAGGDRGSIRRIGNRRSRRPCPRLQPDRPWPALPLITVISRRRWRWPIESSATPERDWIGCDNGPGRRPRPTSLRYRVRQMTMVPEHRRPDGWDGTGQIVDLGWPARRSSRPLQRVGGTSARRAYTRTCQELLPRDGVARSGTALGSVMLPGEPWRCVRGPHASGDSSPRMLPNPIQSGSRSCPQRPLRHQLRRYETASSISLSRRRISSPGIVGRPRCTNGFPANPTK